MIRRQRASLSMAAAVLAAGALLGEPAGGGSRATAQESVVTFSNDVAPILFDACVSCHRPEASAPFSLLTYEDARPWARSIKEQVLRRAMPPWKPEAGYGAFVGERRLSDEQIATVQAWVDGGAPEGDPARLPAAPRWGGRWELGEPDLVLDTDPYTLRAGGDDVYRNFVMPSGTTTTRYVRAWQFVPGNPQVVHHATMHVDPTRASRRLDARDPESGYEGLIPHTAASPDGFFLGWVPGYRPYVAPEGMAWTLREDSDLVMMLHLRPNGTEQTVQTSLALYFSDTPPRLNPMLIRLTRQHMNIAPGVARYVVIDSFTLTADVDVYTVQPHAHYLAKEIKSVATLPDGSRKWLMYIKEWDFEWQGVFRYATPEFLPAGTTITMEYTYDNSAENPNNPHRPPRRVTYGQETTDEMADLWLQVVPRNPADRPQLARAVRDKIVREEIVGIEKRLEADPTNVDLHNDAALFHAEVGNLDGTAAHFAESVRLVPDSAAARYNLGNVQFQRGDREAAGVLFRIALTLKPDYALAHDGLGVVLYTDGKLGEAIEHYRQAIALDPDSPDAYHHLAIALRSLGRLQEALSQYRQALRLDPARPGLQTELAEVEQALADQGVGGRR